MSKATPHNNHRGQASETATGRNQPNGPMRRRLWLYHSIAGSWKLWMRWKNGCFSRPTSLVNEISHTYWLYYHSKNKGRLPASGMGALHLKSHVDATPLPWWMRFQVGYEIAPFMLMIKMLSSPLPEYLKNLFQCQKHLFNNNAFIQIFFFLKQCTLQN